MKPEAIGVLCIFVTFAVLEMWRTNFFHKPMQTKTDIWVELIGSPVLLLITQPFIMSVSYKLMGLVFPDATGALSAIPIIAQVALLLVFDDMAQYLVAPRIA